ncbi:hypothetical protein ACFL45_11860 [Candidatus Neomarinimicrobiota bacterium]
MFLTYIGIVVIHIGKTSMGYSVKTENLRRFYTVALLSGVLALASCTKPPTKSDDEINENILLIKTEKPLAYGDYFIGDWSEGGIYCAAPLYFVQLDQDFNITTDSLLEDYKTEIIYRYLTIHNSGNQLLMVFSKYLSISKGSLEELDTRTNQLEVLRDSTHNISSARYYGDGPDLIYYTYGNEDIELVPGYYHLDRATGRDSLILQHRSVTGTDEVVNGFDIHPDNSRMIFPVSWFDQTPILVEYHFSTGQRDTLPVEFLRSFLWVRYNSTGEQLLYCDYPPGIGGFNVPDNTEIGIIDLSTFERRVLDVNINPYGRSVCTCPAWSPDDQHILYSGAKGPLSEPPGTKSTSSLYLLLHVNP